MTLTADIAWSWEGMRIVLKDQSPTQTLCIDPLADKVCSLLGCCLTTNCSTTDTCIASSVAVYQHVNCNLKCVV